MGAWYILCGSPGHLRPHAGPRQVHPILNGPEPFRPPGRTVLCDIRAVQIETKAETRNGPVRPKEGGGGGQLCAHRNRAWPELHGRSHQNQLVISILVPLKPVSHVRTILGFHRQVIERLPRRRRAAARSWGVASGRALLSKGRRPRIQQQRSHERRPGSAVQNSRGT